MNTPRAHAICSFSGSDMWMNCPPSARASEHVQDTKSKYSDAGTFGHSMTEHCLRNGLTAAQLCGVPQWESSEFFTQDMREAVQFCIDFAWERFIAAKKIDPHAQMFLEQRVDASDIIPEGFGTSDVVLVYGDTVEVIDWKFGSGIRVSAKGNSQLRLYGYGTLRAMEANNELV